MAVQWSGLYEDLWKLILSSLTLHERMRCSIVSTKLNAAAVAATEQFALTYVKPEAKHVPSMKLWIEHHGQHLTSLHLCDFWYAKIIITLTSLPCPRLQQLHLKHVRVQLGSSSEALGVLQASTALSKLVLDSCCVLDASNSLAALTSVEYLQHLELVRLQKDPPPATFWPSQEYANWPMTAVLQHLTGLTALSMSTTSSSVADSLQHISCLTGLQSLKWFSTPSVSASGVLGPNTILDFSKFTALTSISLPVMCFDSAALLCCSQLQRLQLRPDDHLEYLPVDSPGAASTLLSCIACMPRLQQLSIGPNNWQWPQEKALYAALTASSYLTELDLSGCQLPAGAWGAVFLAGHSLPNLKVLACHHQPCHWARSPSDMQTADMAGLVRCCPALQQCSMVMCQDASTGALQQLTGLTGLQLQGAGSSAFEGLATLTSLKSLHVELGGVIVPADALALSALQRLTCLVIEAYAVEDLLDWDVPRNLELVDGGDPVWLQLVQHCEWYG